MIPRKFHASLLFTGEPLNTSLIFMASRAESISFISSLDSVMSPALIFSFSRLSLLGVLLFRQPVKQAEQVLVLSEAFLAELRHVCPIVCHGVETVIFRITSCKQAVCKRRECDEADAQFFERGKNGFVPPSHIFLVRQNTAVRGKPLYKDCGRKCTYSGFCLPEYKRTTGLQIRLNDKRLFERMRLYTANPPALLQEGVYLNVSLTVIPLSDFRLWL